MEKFTRSGWEKSIGVDERAKGGRVLIDQDTTDERAKNCRAALDLDGSLRLRSGQAPTRPHMGGAGPQVLLQVAPVLAYADFYQEWYRQRRVNIFHLLAHQSAHGLNFILGDFEHQFVVDLQRHA